MCGIRSLDESGFRLPRRNNANKQREKRKRDLRECLLLQEFLLDSPNEKTRRVMQKASF